MNYHLTSAPARIYVLERVAPAARRRPQPRRRRHTTRPRDSLNDIAHVNRPPN